MARLISYDYIRQKAFADPDSGEAIVYLQDIAESPTVDAVEVKCKVGDFVYALWEAPVKLKYIIYYAEVKEIRIAIRNCSLITTYRLEPTEYRGHIREYRDADFGTLVFKDKEDAERKLYPCERCISATYHSCEGCSYGERKEGDGNGLF